MGHDIIANKKGVDEDIATEVYKQCGFFDEGKTEDERFEAWEAAERQMRVATLRRSAGNPLNKVIYIVLGVVDEAYAGVSGNGITIPISREQFSTAIDLLQAKDYSKLKLDKDTKLYLSRLIRQMEGNPLCLIDEGNNGSVTREIDFCLRCLAYMEENDIDQLDVFFG